MMTEAMKRMVAVRTALILDEPFWGMLALRLHLREDPSCDTAWVDGRTLGFNPTYITQLPTFNEAKGLFAHEVGHCVLGHPWREGGRDHDQWNEACDRALNPVLRDAGMTLPEGLLLELDASHKGKSAEWIYNRLPRPKEEDCDGCGGTGSGVDGDGEPIAEDCQSCDGSGKQPADAPQPAAPGEVRAAPPEAEETEGEGEEAWKQAVEQAAVIAQGQGKLPGSLARVTAQATVSRVDWRSVTRRFVQEITTSDYSWSQPNRRYLAQGLYLPALHSRELGPLVVFIDTSGSIDSVLLGIAEAELQAIVSETQPRRTHVAYCDSKIQRVDVFEPGDPVTLHPMGGGGTAFEPAFAWLDTLDDEAACVIYLTDLRGTFPQEDPGVPTLWATPKRYDRTVPFGEVILIDE